MVQLLRHVLRCGTGDQGAGVPQAGVQLLALFLFLGVRTDGQRLIEILHRLTGQGFLFGQQHVGDQHQMVAAHQAGGCGEPVGERPG